MLTYWMRFSIGVVFEVMSEFVFTWFSLGESYSRWGRDSSRSCFNMSSSKYSSPLALFSCMRNRFVGIVTVVRNRFGWERQLCCGF